MKKRVLAVGISTREALEEVLGQEICVLYVTAGLYLGMHGSIRELMGRYGYVPAPKSGRRGVFFVKAVGENRFDPEKHEIFDPLDIF